MPRGLTASAAAAILLHSSDDESDSSDSGSEQETEDEELSDRVILTLHPTLLTTMTRGTAFSLEMIILILFHGS